jgi:hypothetical protein
LNQPQAEFRAETAMAKTLVEQGVIDPGRAGTRGRAQKRRAGAGDQFHAAERAGRRWRAPAVSTCGERRRSTPAEDGMTRTTRGRGPEGSKTHREDDGMVEDAGEGQMAARTSPTYAQPESRKTTTLGTGSAPARISLTKRTAAQMRSSWRRRLGSGSTLTAGRWRGRGGGSRWFSGSSS